MQIFFKMDFPIEDYQLKEILGQGAYGIVSLYEKRPSVSSRRANKVAVKIFMSSQIVDFSKELKNMSKIGETSCPNIVQFFGTCSLQRGKKGLVMELFDTNLMEYILSISQPCSLTVGKAILRQVANGLRHLKDLKIVHRDVKPDNILTKTDENRTLRVALTDLGVSKHMTKTQSSNQTNIGTDLWMAPEVKGDGPTYGHPADVFGFGLTAMFILTGKYPLGRDVKPDELSQWVADCLNNTSWSDPKLISLINGCLEYVPTKRIGKSSLIDHEVRNNIDARHPRFPHPPIYLAANSSSDWAPSMRINIGFMMIFVMFLSLLNRGSGSISSVSLQPLGL